MHGGGEHCKKRGFEGQDQEFRFGCVNLTWQCTEIPNVEM
jgi:hypothetical protein